MSDTPNIEWGDPPPPAHGPTPDPIIADFVDILRTRPNIWAKCPTTTNHSSAGSSYRKTYPGTEWTVRKISPNEWAMWAKWVGDE